MAMIFPLPVPPEERDQIAAFMRADGDAPVPELGELGSKVLDRLTRGQGNGLWRVVVGSFNEYSLVAENEEGRTYTTPDGRGSSYADALYDEEGQRTNRWGVVEADLDNPTGIFEVGVPL